MTTYATLQGDFSQWAHRDDLAAKVPTFVLLFETRVNRKLRVRQMETAYAATIVANKTTLPINWAAFKALWLTGSQQHAIQSQPLETVVDRARHSARPTMYAIEGQSARFDGSGDVSGVYYATIPGLVANGTNWLSVAAYDAYLFGVLAEASLFTLDMDRATVSLMKSDGALNEVAIADSRDRFAGRLTARAS